MKRRLALFALLFAAPLLAAERLGPAQFDRIRAVDVAMATIGYRLATANLALCDKRVPVPGLVLHALAQYPPGYRAGARAAFGFETPVAVEGVVADSPALAAGVRAGDGVLAINGVALPGGVGRATDSADRDRALALLAGGAADRPADLLLLRDGQRRRVRVAPSPGCRTSFEVLLTTRFTARADGNVVQVSARYFDLYEPGQVAAVVAHEFAHNLLRHRQRLEAAGVRRGLFEGVGRSARLIRGTEDEADALSVALLYNAGYDPAAAVRFWRDPGEDDESGPFRSTTHASSDDRARAIAVEIARMPAAVRRPYVPAVLATRAEPLR
jgi:hypothetical protein